MLIPLLKSEVSVSVRNLRSATKCAAANYHYEFILLSLCNLERVYLYCIRNSKNYI